MAALGAGPIEDVAVRRSERHKTGPLH
jgi:hypothetical protein